MNTRSQPTASIVEKAAQYVSQLLQDRLAGAYTFHNLEHTREVVAEAERIGRACGLSDTEMCILLTAAWFHDIGYIEAYENHEVVGAQIAEEFLLAEECPPEFVECVASCILATQMPQQPRNTIEQVLCDADVANLGSDSFFEMSTKLRTELAAIKGEVFSDEEWRDICYTFCKFHRFHTEYSRRVLGIKQQENLLMLEREHIVPTQRTTITYLPS
ncbi:MAG: HD domain-containing protein [Bacteroidota bacterium]|nr:HD domain-containing protein [Candidatus Kapabacteria bacterium]MDW8219687.1 HD domain-containing protein [Bacteroidota bacterium]